MSEDTAMPLSRLIASALLSGLVLACGACTNGTITHTDTRPPSSGPHAHPWIMPGTILGKHWPIEIKTWSTQDGARIGAQAVNVQDIVLGYGPLAFQLFHQVGETWVWGTRPPHPPRSSGPHGVIAAIRIMNPGHVATTFFPRDAAQPPIPADTYRVCFRFSVQARQGHEAEVACSEAFFHKGPE